MAQYAVTGDPAKPMPVRTSAWAIYDIFETADDDQVFVAVVSDTQWLKFCLDFGLSEFADDEGLRTNNNRVERRDELLPVVRDLFRQFSKKELMNKLDASGLPFSSIGRPEELFDDPHLNHSGGLLNVQIPGGKTTKLPALPLEMNGSRPGLQHDIPVAGGDSLSILKTAGFTEDEIKALLENGTVKTES